MAGLPEGPELLGLAEGAVKRALARGANEAECYWSASESIDLDIERGVLAACGHSRRSGGGLRVVSAGRVGFAYFAAESDVPEAVEKALRQARIAPPKGYQLPDAGRASPLGGRWDEAIAGLDPGPAVSLVDDMLQGVREACPDAVVAGGGAELSAGVDALASSRGVACWDRATEMSLGLSAILEDGETAIAVWEGDGVHAGNLDGHALGAEAGRKALSLRNPQPLSSGRSLDVVFLPDAFSELLDTVVDGAMGDEAMRGKTVWSDRLGQQVAAPGVTLLDDARREGGLGTTPFDGEGLPTSALPIVREGILERYLFDSWDGHEHNRASTASAQRASFKSLPSTGVHHLVLEVKDSMSMEQLVGGIDDGLVVESVLGAHTANQTTGDFSITAPNAWLISGGELAGPVEEVALAGNLPALLMCLDGASDRPKRLDGAMLPATRFRGVHASV